MDRKINAAWVDGQLRNAGMQRKDLGRALGVSESTFSRMMSGQRRWQASEMAKAAETLGVPLPDLMSHLGVPVKGRAGAVDVGEDAPIIGTVDADGAVRITSKSASPTRVRALRVRGDTWADGCLIGFVPSAVSRGQPAVQGAPYIVTTVDGRTLLRAVLPGYAPGTFNLRPYYGLGADEDDVPVVGCAPVVWVRPHQIVAEGAISG